MTSRLPDDVEQIIEYLAGMARGYGNRLKWNEEAKFKSDLMKVKHRWHPERVPAAVFQERCLGYGMREDDSKTLVDYLKRAQAGRRLVPQHSYRGFKFAPEPKD